MSTEPQSLSSCGCCKSGEKEPGRENRPGQSTLHYRIATHATFLRRMLADLSRQAIPDGTHAGERPLAELTTRATDDASIAMLDAWATAADVLTFYQERIAREGFLRTATERRSILELARAIGYELNPGVAAGTVLAFTVDDSEGAPNTAVIRKGTQVQSIPAREGELPQTFETSVDFEARVEWNALKPRQTVHHPIEAGVQELYFKGVNLGLKPGDVILIVGPEREKDPGNENWDVRPLKTVREIPGDGTTVVTWEEGLGWKRFGRQITPAADKTARVFVLRKRLALFGHNAPDWRVMSEAVRETYCPKGDAACVGGREWPGFPLSSGSKQLHIDGDHPEILAPTWIALSDENYTELYLVKEAVPSSQTDFALTARTTRVTLDTTESLLEFNRRTALVLAVPEELERAEKRLQTRVKDSTIELDAPVTGLLRGQPLIISGRLNAADEEPVSEVGIFDPPVEAESYTSLHLKKALRNELVRSTVTIHANVVPATHGETVTAEVLGSGDGTESNQRFTPKRSPLTFVPASTASGAESSLEVRIDEVLWREVPSLYGKGPSDRFFIVRIDDDARATVIFGDGKQGARLPTGRENVRATYRFGIGGDGEVGEKTLALLKKRPFGVRGVSNPIAAGAAASPEKLETARANAPLTVLTLDRIVSLRDFEDFARAFAGIGKAQAVSVWNGETSLVHITVADDEGDPVTDDTLGKLRDAIDTARDPSVEVMVDNYEPLAFQMEATVFYDAAFIQEKLKAAIEDTLRAAFSFEGRSLGRPVTAAEIISVIQPLEGVIAVDLDALHAEPPKGLPITALGAAGQRKWMAGPTGIAGSRFSGILPHGRPPASFGKAARLAGVLPARTARRTNGSILPAQLLVLDEAGIHLTMKAV